MRLLRGALLLVCALLVAGAAAAATRYDPRLRFRTLSTARFDIHFHQGGEAIARRLAGFIEEAAATVDRAIGSPSGRVQVILVDQHDVSNGWATPLPYNTIEISVAAPAAGSGIGHTSDWLRLVFVHEYTHIAHLSRAGGWIGALRRGFGRHPLLFPNLFQPVWGIEGLATWQETDATREGRLAAGDFRQILTYAAAADRFDPLDRVNGGNVDWPGGNAPYVYGAYFHQFLAQQYGEPRMADLVRETGRALPYLGSRAYKKVFGRSLGQLWNEFREASVSAAARDAAPARATRLTSHGFAVSGPRIAPDGGIYYSAASPHHFPALMVLPPGGTPVRVAPRYLGSALAFAMGLIVFDQLDLVRSVGLQSDLYVMDLQGGSPRAITRGARAADPDVSGADGRVVCTVQRGDRREIATLQLGRDRRPATPETLVSEPWTQFAGPRWSPDGRLIAAERRRLGHPSEIVVIDPVSRRVTVLAALPGGRSGSPAWLPDGTSVLFSSAPPGESFAIYSVALAGGAVRRLEGTGSAQSPDVSRDGKTVVYVGYTADGYDLFSLPLADARWVDVDASTGTDTTVASGPMAEGTAGDYSPWRTLAPRFWMPTAESDADEIVVGAATGGADVLGRHTFAAEAGWSTRRRPDWRLAYAYDRWRPTLFAGFADDTDPWLGGEVRSLEADAGLLWRFARVRHTQTVLASVHAAEDRFACDDCAPSLLEASERRAALRLGWEVTSARSFGYSISPEEGGRIAATLEGIRGVGHTRGTAVAATAAGSRYWRVWPRHGVVALRGAAAGSRGDAGVARVFTAAGSGPQPGGFDYGRGAVGLLRGFSDDAAPGTAVAVANLDYRFPLSRVDRGVGTLPVFLRVLHGAVFADAGTVRTTAREWTRPRFSVGAELSADGVLGFVVPLTISGGVAWRRDPGGAESGIAAFARIGRAF